MYIDADKLIAEIKRYKNKADERLKIKGRTFSEEQKDLALQNLCGNLLYFINSSQQELPKLYKDESLGSPDYERGFKHGRDYQTEVSRKYTNKDKVVAYLVGKGYPVSTSGEIPTYQETFDIVKNAIEYSNNQGQSEVDIEKEIATYFHDWIDDVEENVNPNGIEISKGRYAHLSDIEQAARYFYKLGLNARK